MQFVEVEKFAALIFASAGIYTWIIDYQDGIQWTNCNNLKAATFLSKFGGDESVLSHKAILQQQDEKTKGPWVIGGRHNIIWAWEKVPGTQHSVLLGPIILGTSNSNVEMRDNQTIAGIAIKDIPIEYIQTVREFLASIPILLMPSIYRYILMLHYCLTNQSITVSEINNTGIRNTVAEVPQAGTRDRRLVYFAEQQLLDAVRRGSSSYNKVFSRSSLISSGIPLSGFKQIERAKLNLSVFTSLVTRAAIEGGLDPNAAYPLGDDWIQRIYHTENLTELSAIGISMYADFITRVQQVGVRNTYSQVTRSTLAYLDDHFDHQVSATEVAHAIGFAPYYVTRKFHEDLGISMNEYLRNRRIKHAQGYLAFSNLDIETIARECGFGTRNRFTTVFKQEVGVTPSQYRAHPLDSHTEDDSNGLGQVRLT